MSRPADTGQRALLAELAALLPALLEAAERGGWESGIDTVAAVRALLPRLAAPPRSLPRKSFSSGSEPATLERQMPCRVETARTVGELRALAARADRTSRVHVVVRTHPFDGRWQVIFPRLDAFLDAIRDLPDQWELPGTLGAMDGPELLVGA